MKTALLITLLAVSASHAAVLVDFSDKPLAAGTYANNTGGFTSNGVSFNNKFVDYGGGYSSWSGFSLSAVNDPTTPGYGNQYAAAAGPGVGGSGTYAVAYPTATIDLPAGTSPESVRLTNTTYAAKSMQNGDSFAKRFGGTTGNDPDYFTVTFTGYAAPGAAGATTGSATFYLADYRAAGTASDYVVTNWSTLSLTSLGAARSIGLSFASSDVGAYGINTPTYVAIDNLALLPEPATLAALALPLLALRRRR